MKKVLVAIAALAVTLCQTVYGAEMSDWALEDYSSASERGLIPLSVALSNLKDDITRSEFCNLAINMFDTIHKGDVKLFECPFTDCNDDFIVKAYSLGIVSGKSETEFCPYAPVTRQEMAKILVNTLEIAGKKLPVADMRAEKAYNYADFDDIASWAKLDFVKAVKYELINGVSDTELKPNDNASREQAVAIISRSEERFVQNAEVYQKPEISNMKDGDSVSGALSVTWVKKASDKEYIIIVKDENYNYIDVSASVTNSAGISTENFDVGKKYTITVAAISENQKAVYSDYVEVQYNEEEKRFEILATRDEKYRRVFPSGVPFKTESEAAGNMADIKVPVWHLNSDGTKSPSKMELTVNANLAEDVVRIFTEIYEDAERFPIKNVGGYAWRNSAMGKLSEHSYGTCIDINYDENYYCYADTGAAITGSFWHPLDNPYSIPENGSVVRIFAKYGWAWGGNAWSRLHDYMHFTYLGN